MDYNENEDVIEVEDEDIEEETSEPTEDPSELKARIKRLEEKAIAQRERTRMLRQELQKNKPKAEAPKEEKKNGLDKLDRAVLRVEKITHQDDIGLVEDWMKDTGKDIEQVLASVRFQSELKELQDKRAAQEAAPQNSKRSGQSARDEVDYWLAKGPGPEGLPKDNPALAQKVVQARRAQAQRANQFSDEPIQ